MNQPTEPVEILSYETPGKHKIWSVGTLKYTRPALAVLFFWLLWGDFALNVRERSISPVSQLVLTKLNTNNTWLGVLTVALPSFISMVLVPIITFRSDLHRGKWGRRIPYLVVVTPIAAFAMLGLSRTMELGEWLNRILGHASGGLEVSRTIVFAVFWICFELAAVLTVPLTSALINDVVPRELLGRFYGWFRAVSLIVGVIFFRYVMGVADQRFGQIFFFTGLLFGVGFTLMCFMVKEGEYPPPEIRHDDFRARGYIPMLISYARECFSQPYNLCMFFALMAASLVFNPVNWFSVKYYKELGMSGQEYGNVVALTYIFSLVLAYPLGVLADRFHPLRVSIAALVLYMLAAMYGMLFIKDVPTFRIAFLAHGVFSGVYFTASGSIGQKLFPKEKFGQFAAAAVLIASLFNIVTPPIVGQILDQSHNDYRQTFTIGFIFSIVAILLMVTVYWRFMRMGGPSGYVLPPLRNVSRNCRRISTGLAVVTLVLAVGVASLLMASRNQVSEHRAWKADQRQHWEGWGVYNADDLALAVQKDPMIASLDKEQSNSLNQTKDAVKDKWTGTRGYRIWSILSQTTTFVAPEQIDSYLAFVPGFVEVIMFGFIAWVFHKAAQTEPVAAT